MKVKYIGKKGMFDHLFTNPDGILEFDKKYTVMQISCDPENDDLSTIILLDVVGKFCYSWFKICK